MRAGWEREGGTDGDGEERERRESQGPTGNENPRGKEGRAARRTDGRREVVRLGDVLKKFKVRKTSLAAPVDETRRTTGLARRKRGAAFVLPASPVRGP